MGMSDIMNRAHKPVIGECYTVNELELRTVEDKYNPGQTRDVLIMYTDKGGIYATSAMAKAAAEDMNDAESYLIGKTIVACEYYNARMNRNLITFELQSNHLNII